MILSKTIERCQHTLASKSLFLRSSLGLEINLLYLTYIDSNQSRSVTSSIIDHIWLIKYFCYLFFILIIIFPLFYINCMIIGTWKRMIPGFQKLRTFVKPQFLYKNHITPTSPCSLNMDKC